jgi:hypothetical protein
MPDDTKNWEQRATAAEAKLDELNATLAQTREALDASERRRTIDGELAQSEALDLETARLLTEAAVAQMGQPDIAKAVADLKKRKPFLFRPRHPHRPAASAMSPTDKPARTDELAQIAEQARTTGDKRALLQYLRARRNA